MAAKENNERVTQALLYKELLDFRSHVDERLDTVERIAHERMARVDDRITTLAERMTVHEESEHTGSTAKSSGIAGAIAVIVTALAAFIEHALKRY